MEDCGALSDDPGEGSLCVVQGGDPVAIVLGAGVDAVVVTASTAGEGLQGKHIVHSAKCHSKVSSAGNLDKQMFSLAIKSQAVLTTISAVSSLVSSLLSWKVPEAAFGVGPTGQHLANDWVVISSKM